MLGHFQVASGPRSLLRMNPLRTKPRHRKPHHRSPAAALLQRTSRTITTHTHNRQRREDCIENILADNYAALDHTLPNSVAALKARGAHRCWHKHSTFLAHLLGVHNILRLWDQGETAGRVGLFHSAYSNSYVNTALFDPRQESERQRMAQLIGEPAEDLVHLFCIIDRQSIVVNTLLKDGHIPPQGIIVPRLPRLHNNKIIEEERGATDVHITAEQLHLLCVFTMADIADQYFGWQDRLFGGEAMVNSMLIPGADDVHSHDSGALWPGLSQPGLWMSYVSQLGAVARAYRSACERTSTEVPTSVAGASAVVKPSLGCETPRLPLPPVFDDCAVVLTRREEALARGLYWSVVTGEVKEADQAISVLLECVRRNPFTFEPHVLLAQYHLHRNDFEAGSKAAHQALDLAMKWGTAWDKRISFGAWVAWIRVLQQRAEDELDWPQNSWDVNNFGFVR